MKVGISVKEGSHQSEQAGESIRSQSESPRVLRTNHIGAVNKQLNDKERVAAALENITLLEVVNNCLSSAGLRGRDPIEAA